MCCKFTYKGLSGWYISKVNEKNEKVETFSFRQRGNDTSYTIVNGELTLVIINGRMQNIEPYIIKAKELLENATIDNTSTKRLLRPRMA